MDIVSSFVCVALFPAQFFGEPGISGEDDTEQTLGIEAGAGQQAQFAEHRGIHLLGFVDEQHRAAVGGSRWASQRSRRALKPPQRLLGLRETVKISPSSR
jgi:hypothetical protein